MSRSVPFVAHIKIIPERPGKRQEYLASVSKISALIYNALSQSASINIAIPGGGQSPSFGSLNLRPAFGNYANGLAAKPQFGATPAQLMVNGFYNSSLDNIQDWDSHTVISGGAVYHGNTSNSALATPVSSIDAEVKTLRNLLDSLISSVIPENIEYSIFRLDYSGIVYGDRGFSFPR